MSDAKSPSDLSMDEILATIRRIIADEEQPGAATPPVAAPRAPQEPPGHEEVLELTQALNEDGSVRHLAPRGVAPPRPAPPAERVEPQAPALAADEGIVSEGASLAAAAAFAHLAQVPHGRETPRIGDRTLEECVGELLRPLLKAWLDDHLPQLVERLVRAEIARVIARSGVD